MLAAASPLPREDTTPPVMKIYFGIRPSVFVISLSCPPRYPRSTAAGLASRAARRGSRASTGRRRREQPPHLLQVLRRVDAEGFVLRLHRFDADAVFERAQRLERFG